MRRGSSKISAIAVAATLIAPSTASADIWVDAGSVGGSCSDARPIEAVTVATPWCSLDRAVSAAPPGSVVRVRGGSYPAITVPARAAISFAAAPGERPAIAAVGTEGTQGIALHGFQLGAMRLGPATRGADVRGNIISPGGVVIDEGVVGAHFEGNTFTVPRGNGIIFSAQPPEPPVQDITIAGNRFENIGVVGVNARHFRRVTVRNNTFTNVHSWNGTVHPDVVRTFNGGEDLVVSGNYMHGNRAQGIFLKDGFVRRVLIENNVITRTAPPWTPLNIYGADDVRIRNNTIVANGGANVINTGVRNVSLRNNIMTDRLSVEDPASVIYEDYNLFPSRRPRQGPHTLNGMPAFVDPQNGDFQLRDHSIGVDAGTSDGIGPVDMRGAPRAVEHPHVRNRGGGTAPFVDMGAVETQPAAAPVGLSTENRVGGDSRGPTAFPVRLLTASRQRLSRRNALAVRAACDVSRCLMRISIRVRLGKRIYRSAHVWRDLEHGEVTRANPRFKNRTASRVRRLLRRQRRGVMMTVVAVAVDRSDTSRRGFASRRVRVRSPRR